MNRKSADAPEKSQLKKSSLLCLAGFVLLVNPAINIVDIIPDFIGWILIIAGLSSYSLISERIKSASKNAYILLAISLLKLAFTIPALTTKQGSDLLLLAFSFSVVEVFFLLVFFYNLFEGIVFLATVYDCENVIRVIDNAKFLSYLFAITRAVCPVLPELLSITELEAGAVEDAELAARLLDYSSMKPYAVILFCIISLIIGIVWFVRFCPVIAGLHQSPAIHAEYRLQYDKIPQRKSSAYIKTGAIICIVAMFCAFDFRVDGIPVLPMFGLPLLLFAGSFVFSRVLPFAKTMRYMLLASVTGIGFEVLQHFLINKEVFAPELLTPSKLVILCFCALIFTVLLQLALKAFYTDLKTLIPDNGFFFQQLPVLPICALYTVMAVMPSLDIYLSTAQILLCAAWAALNIKVLVPLAEARKKS